MCLAVPGRLVEVHEHAGMLRAGKVDFSGVVREVNLAFVPEAEPGDYVLVHVGVALSRVDEEEANKVFEYLRELGEAEDAAEETR